MFSVRRETRARYHALFVAREIEKRYAALAPPLPHMTFPCVRRTRLEPGVPFFRMQEAAGEPNSETRIDVRERGSLRWCYELTPTTGRKHQLRVHMAALGAPIEGDRCYPVLVDRADDPAQPLALLAERLAFMDPVSGCRREFQSSRTLPAA
jgi:tRNA pseudouridine32 synthase/23S rRNA pseudouridine746 synthase